MSALAAAAVLSLVAPAGASISGGGSRLAAGHETQTVALDLRAMPAGAVTFGRADHGRLTVHARVYGLTPGSSHNVDLVLPGRPGSIRFPPLTANGIGQANSTLLSGYKGLVPQRSRLVIRMGVQSDRVAREPIAITWRLNRLGRRAHRLISVEVSRHGISYGTPQGLATVVYNSSRHTLTVTVSARGITPGPHAAHIHLGSCQSQGPVLYMLRDLTANRHGRIVHAVRVFTNVNAPIPGRGWYLNIHQGNSGDIVSNGAPTIFFRPLICANIK